MQFNCECFFVCFIISLILPPISGKYWKWLKDPLWLSSHKGYRPTIRHQSVPLNLSSSAFKRQSHEFAFWWVLLERVLMSVPILSFSQPEVTHFHQLLESSGVNVEREQLLWVHVIQRAQVRKFEQQLGESGGVIRGILADEGSESPD